MSDDPAVEQRGSKEADAISKIAAASFDLSPIYKSYADYAYRDGQKPERPQ